MPKPNSPWLAEKPGERFPTITSDVRVDVAVVGGGITGVTLAHQLKKAGLTVALLEQHEVAGGETGHTTAHLTMALDSGLPTLVRNFGEDGARKLWQAGRAAIDHIEETVRQEQLDCDFRRVDGYLFAAEAADVSRVEEELTLARRLGFRAEPSRMRAYPPMHFRAMRLPRQAQFHVTRYLLPLARLIPGGGSYVYEHAHVSQVHHGVPARLEVGGYVVTADHVVYATHQPIHDKLFVAKVAAYQTYAIGLKIPKGSFPYALAWDTAEPYHYWRQTPFHGQDLLIVGGEDHRTGQEDDTEARFQALEAYVERELKHVKHQRAFRWSGQVLSPMDGAPFIGRLGGLPNAYVATGYNGNGMTMGTFAALLLADLILDKPHPLASLVDPTRFKVAAGGVTFLEENLAYPAYLAKDRLSPAECQAVEAIEPGHGCVVELAGEAVAASKDDDGNVQAVSAVCTHMGCLVHWNGAERTWDCPCHGSRFQTDGKVLSGPAIEGLPPAKALVEPPPKASRRR